MQATATQTDFIISRKLNAPRELVWKLWTEKEHLDKWFGPTGATIPYSSLDFRVGGRYHYQMFSAEGFEMWGKWEFQEIVKPEHIIWISSFSDPVGTTKPAPFEGKWPVEIYTVVTFDQVNGMTEVGLHWKA